MFLSPSEWLIFFIFLFHYESHIDWDNGRTICKIKIRITAYIHVKMRYYVCYRFNLHVCLNFLFVPLVTAYCCFFRAFLALQTTFGVCINLFGLRNLAPLPNSLTAYNSSKHSSAVPKYNIQNSILLHIHVSP